MPAPVQLVTDVIYSVTTTDDARRHELTLDAAFPANAGAELAPAVVYIHGGGYVVGSKAHGREFIRALAAGGYFAVAINYRLAGDARYPAAVHDCKAAVRFLRANAGEMAIDPQRIGVWGHSAGGHLSALLAVTGDEVETDGTVGPPGVSTAVACAVSISGPTDLVGRSNRQGRRILARWFQREGEALRAALAGATPMSWVDAGDPPMLLIHGDVDGLVPVRHAVELDAALRQAGVASSLLRFPDQGHIITEVEAYRAVAAFFDEHLGGNATGVVDRFAP
jgi:pectinesterase